SADVNHDVEDGPSHDTNELGLRATPLPVKPAQRPRHGPGMVVLDEGGLDPDRGELIGSIRFEEESSRVAMNRGLEDLHPRQCRRYGSHRELHTSSHEVLNGPTAR